MLIPFTFHTLLDFQIFHLLQTKQTWVRPNSPEGQQACTVQPFPPFTVLHTYRLNIDGEKLWSSSSSSSHDWMNNIFVLLGAGYINGSANSRRLHSQIWVHNKPSMQLLSQLSSTGRFNIYLQPMYALKTMNLFADFTILDAHYSRLWFHQNSVDYFIVITFYSSVQFAHSIGL